MKKILLLSLLTIQSVSAGTLYIETTKQTNGSYIWKIPAIETEITQGKFIYKPEIALLFTSERNDMMSINHHSFDINNNFGTMYNDYYITFSLGIRYNFAGNDDKLQEGLNFYNTARIGLKF
jgi:hypothetical protein